MSEVLWAERGGVPVPRNYGDPAGEYAAAVGDVVAIDRRDRVPVRVFGRDPLKMMQGLLSNDLAGAADGRGVYATLLSPKGRLVADVRAWKRPPDVWMDVDRGALGGLLSMLKKFVPPLFARFEDASDALGVFGVYGPNARDVVVQVAGDAPPADAPEESFVACGHDAGEVLVMRTYLTGDTGGYDVVAPAAAFEALWDAAVERGARPAGFATLDVLRIEAGRPVWGAELGEDVIPLEAGLRERAISETKGCYTGQEVIIRILHRGHVNRHLRGLLLGELPTPSKETPLFRPADGRQVGSVTSACVSPRLGQTIALAYVRREVEPPASLRIGSYDGPEVGVVVLPFRHRE